VCSNESEEPPGPADVVDLPIADILFPSIPVLTTALDTIEDSEETDSPPMEESDLEEAISERDLENIITPPVPIEREMESVGADIPVVTQEDPDDDMTLGDSGVDATQAADAINTTFGYLRNMDGSPCEFVDILSH
jgi:hypothetical protein